MLYGRYWGTRRGAPLPPLQRLLLRRDRALHRAGFDRFEPGAGGEFKWLRGFDPAPTRSMHYLRDARLAHAVSEYVTAEREIIEREMDTLLAQSQLKGEE